MLTKVLISSFMANGPMVDGLTVIQDAKKIEIEIKDDPSFLEETRMEPAARPKALPAWATKMNESQSAGLSDDEMRAAIANAKTAGTKAGAKIQIEQKALQALIDKKAKQQKAEENKKKAEETRIGKEAILKQLGVVPENQWYTADGKKFTETAEQAIKAYNERKKQEETKQKAATKLEEAERKKRAKEDEKKRAKEVETQKKQGDKEQAVAADRKLREEQITAARDGLLAKMDQLGEKVTALSPDKTTPENASDLLGEAGMVIAMGKDISTIANTWATAISKEKPVKAKANTVEEDNVGKADVTDVEEDNVGKANTVDVTDDVEKL